MRPKITCRLRPLLLAAFVLTFNRAVSPHVPEGGEDKFKGEPPGINRVDRFASFVVQQPVSELVTEVRTKRDAEQSLNLECQAIPKDLGSLGKIHQSAKPVFVLDTILVEVCGPHPSCIEVPTNHMFDLRYQYVERPGKVPFVSEKKRLPKKTLTTIRNDRGVTSDFYKVAFSQSVFQNQNLQCWPDCPLNN